MKIQIKSKVKLVGNGLGKKETFNRLIFYQQFASVNLTFHREPQRFPTGITGKLIDILIG